MCEAERAPGSVHHLPDGGGGAAHLQQVQEGRAPGRQSLHRPEGTTLGDSRGDQRARQSAVVQTCVVTHFPVALSALAGDSLGLARTSSVPGLTPTIPPRPGPSLSWGTKPVVLFIASWFGAWHFHWQNAVLLLGWKCHILQKRGLPTCGRKIPGSSSHAFL